MTARVDFFHGARKCAPIALSAVPFGAAVGLAAADVGLSPVEASLMSIIVFAGAAQLAVLELAKTGAPAAVMVLVAVTINLRFAMYSAALAGWMNAVPSSSDPPVGRHDERADPSPSRRPPSRPVRALLSYLLTDQAFAVTSMEDDDSDAPLNRLAFYFGAALTLWVAWQIGTVVGVLVGVRVPENLGIEFVAPLAFVALGASAIRNRVDGISAACSVATYIAIQSLPHGLALIPAAGVGLACRALLGRIGARS